MGGITGLSKFQVTLERRDCGVNTLRCLAETTGKTAMVFAEIGYPNDNQIGGGCV